MSKAAPKDKRIDFAVRHAVPLIDTFNAASAIYRAEQILAEIEEFHSRFGDLRRQFSSQPVEFTHYYTVALMKCMEWHARSRLLDLLSYDAINFTADDVRKASSGSLLEQLLREQITVAQLVASSTLVNNLE